jgi:hypothetical protein
MPAGNASNTVFTSIPVGEDFFMSFSTQRFHRNIAPRDITYLNFKLYDARIIGDVGNPNPNALIKEYNDQLPTDVVYSDEEWANPNGRPGSFKTHSDSIAVLIASADLDEYERTKTGNNNAIFRGELYGYLEAVVTGEETKFARLTTVVTRSKLTATGDLAGTNNDLWWDSHFYREDVRTVKAKLTVVPAALGVITSE